MSVFYDHVMNENKIIGEILKNNKDMLPLTNEQQTEYDAATHCTAWEKPQSSSHCHVNGNFLFPSSKKL